MQTDDPRVPGEYTRRVSCGRDVGTVTLVGVVHDHPASIYRVEQRVAAIDPDVLAPELSPIAVPLFEQYASQDRTPPAFGGEMSAAIRTADCARIVGIDGPSFGFLDRLLRTIAGEVRSLDTIGTVAKNVVPVTREALLCRIAAVLAAQTELRIAVGTPVSHDCMPADAPKVQAADERRRIDRAEATLQAFETPVASDCRERAREAHMADRLSSLRQSGEVVAVVGVDHLDAIADRLCSQSENEGDHREDDEQDDEPARDLHADSRDSARPEDRSNEGEYEERERDFEKLARKILKRYDDFVDAVHDDPIARECRNHWCDPAITFLCALLCKQSITDAVGGCRDSHHNGTDMR